MLVVYYAIVPPSKPRYFGALGLDFSDKAFTFAVAGMVRSFCGADLRQHPLAVYGAANPEVGDGKRLFAVGDLWGGVDGEDTLPAGFQGKAEVAVKPPEGIGFCLLCAPRMELELSVLREAAGRSDRTAFLSVLSPRAKHIPSLCF